MTRKMPDFQLPDWNPATSCHEWIFLPRPILSDYRLPSPVDADANPMRLAGGIMRLLCLLLGNTEGQTERLERSDSQF